MVSGLGHWFKNGEGLVPLRWVFVRDLSGTHRDEYFFTTDPTMTPRTIVETYTGRWSIETTFQEMRAYLGLETTRGRTEKTVLRAAPCLFGLFSVVALWYAQLPLPRTARPALLCPARPTERSPMRSPSCVAGFGPTGFLQHPGITKPLQNYLGL